MTKTEKHAENTSARAYPCRLPPTTHTVNHPAGLLRRHLKTTRTQWPILPPGKIAVTVLAVLRHDQRPADIAGGNNVSESTVRRRRDELIALPAAQAPRLDRALKKVARQGGEVALIDSTLIPTQRRTGKADPRNYSGKHRHHGLHFLALTDEKGRLIWISAARPGRTHDITAAHHDHILAHLHAVGPGTLTDLGFHGLDNDVLDPVVITGFSATRVHKPTPGQKIANQVLATGHAPVEHGFAHLKNWRVLTKLRTTTPSRLSACRSGHSSAPSHSRCPGSRRTCSHHPPGSHSTHADRGQAVGRPAFSLDEAGPTEGTGGSPDAYNDVNDARQTMKLMPRRQTSTLERPQPQPEQAPHAPTGKPGPTPGPGPHATFRTYRRSRCHCPSSHSHNPRTTDSTTTTTPAKDYHTH